MRKFHHLEVASIRRETAGCVSIEFKIPAESRSEFDFKAGQHVTLRTVLDGEEVRRSYSICSAPLETEFRIAVKEVEGGKFSTFANRILRPGQILEVMPPLGTFTLPFSTTQRKHYVAFVAGSGITPVFSMMKTALAWEAGSHFTLFYGNKDADSIIFKNEISDLKNKYLDRLSVHYVLSKEDPGAALFHGRIDASKCESFLQHIAPVHAADDFLICGPFGMIEEIRSLLLRKGVLPAHIHSELFGVPVSSATETRPPGEPSDLVSEITLTIDGNTFSFSPSANSISILEAAQQAGADLPYACKAGVCCTCKAKLIAGEVDVRLNYGLMEEELQQGYVLTCQALPKSAQVVLSFDE
jgi:ring-1,2-phenylacetyl-CoA epoxidase subunit PaaE